VDGHVDAETIPHLIHAGADQFCVGSAIFHSGKTPEESVKDLRQLVDSLTEKK
jgi:pentose-5-phosphate-3-epimerase